LGLILDSSVLIAGERRGETGRIEGEQAARGVSIAVEDLVIGATVLHLGFDVLTLNVRHFQLICDFPSIFAQPSYTAMRRAAILGSAAAFQPPPTDTSTHSHNLFNPARPEARLIPGLKVITL